MKIDDRTHNVDITLERDDEPLREPGGKLRRVIPMTEPTRLAPKGLR